MLKKSLSILILIFPAIAIAAPITVSVTTAAHQYTTMSGGQVYTKAEHDIEILNNSDTNKTFNYSYVYCGEMIRDCVYYNGTITVNAHGRWNNHRDSYLTGKYNYPGNFGLTAITQVAGEVSKEYKAFGSVYVR